MCVCVCVYVCVCVCVCIYIYIYIYIYIHEGIGNALNCKNFTSSFWRCSSVFRNFTMIDYS